MQKTNFEIELEIALEEFLKTNTTHNPKVILPKSEAWRGLTGYVTEAAYLVSIEYGDVDKITVVGY